MPIPANLVQSLSGRYHIDRELGRGGMATVYLADDLKHGRQVAIKVMHPELAAAIGLDRFLREIEIAARLSHPHILPLFDSGAADGHPYYVTPYVIGESLRKRLDRERQLPVEEAIRLAHEIASALGYAHRQGIVHRDIKPENVLLADGIALVADFGIARAIRPAEGAAAPDAATVMMMTTAGAAVGTPLYMAPEQATGGEVDGRADLYALACVLYEMLAGQPPFSAPTVDGLMRMHLTAEPTPVAVLRPGLPAGVAAAIAKGLAKIPADRYPSAARFAEALTAGSGPTTPTAAGMEAATPNNLPKQRTQFIGRERELAECARLLGDTRLLTLTGVGGCGKTRLGLKLGESLLHSYPDGVWFVDFAPVPERDRVPLTVIETLGVKPDPGVPALTTLAEHVATRRMAVILDNCEHLVSACASLVDRLLQSAENLKVIATSREGLGVEGERLFALRSLSVPAREQERDVAAVEATESARLFVDRARLVDARFELDVSTAPAVAEICRRLDGIPLAIELAAARVKLLSVDEIRSRLDDRFRLLTGGSKTSLPRHQTLRATVAWSYDQLTGDEQRLLRLLAVFVGGWTLPAATAVWGDDADEFEVLELLGRLVDKSLVSVARLPDQSTRYSMLETVRQFAQEHLDESGEGTAARTRHLDHFIRLVGESKIHGPDGGAWRQRLDREQENLLAAHRWCDSAERGGEKGLQLIAFESSYWGDRGFIELGLQLAEDALRRPGAEKRTVQRAQCLFRAGHLRHHLMQLNEAIRYGDEMQSIAEELDDQVQLTVALCHLSWTIQSKLDWPTAQRHADAALVAARASGRPAPVLRALWCLSGIKIAIEDFDAALPIVDEALALAREGGSREAVSGMLLARAQILISRGEAGEAYGALLEALDVAKELGPRLVQLVLDVVAAAAAAVGQPEAAVRFLGQSEAIRERMKLHREPVDEQFLSRWMDRARARVTEDAWSAAEAAGRALSYERSLADAREWLGSAPAHEARH